MNREDKHIDGCLFKWQENLQLWSSPHNDPDRIREVQVIPPQDDTPSWRVVVPSTGSSDTLAGAQVEDRAFAVAETYTRQKDWSLTKLVSFFIFIAFS